MKRIAFLLLLTLCGCDSSPKHAKAYAIHCDFGGGQVIDLEPIYYPSQYNYDDINFEFRDNKIYLRPSTMCYIHDTSKSFPDKLYQ